MPRAKGVPMNFTSMSRKDVPEGRNGKHKEIVTKIISDLDRLTPGIALKVPLARLAESKEKVRSALNRATRKGGRSVATASDEAFLYVWNEEAQDLDSLPRSFDLPLAPWLLHALVMGRPNIGDHVLAGLVGGLAGCFAMEHFQRLLGRLSPDLGGAPGAGGQQYRRPQSEPSTYLAADKITRAATGRPLRAENRPAGGSIVHYIFGGTVGAAYGLLTAYRPAAASGRGMPFAVAVWLVADEAGMPLAGLARRPSAYPPTDHLSTFATHLLFGATLETVGRVCLWPDPDRQRPPVWASLRLRPQPAVSVDPESGVARLARPRKETVRQADDSPAPPDRFSALTLGTRVDPAVRMAKSHTRPQGDNTQASSVSESTPYSSSSTGGYDRDRVATRAYELYMERGGGDGNDMEDWFTAEREFSSNGDSQAAKNLREADE